MYKMKQQVLLREAAASYPEDLAEMINNDFWACTDNRFSKKMKQSYIVRRYHLGFPQIEKRSYCLA